MQRTLRDTEVRYVSSGLLISLLVLPLTALAGTLGIGRPTVEDSSYVFPITLGSSSGQVAALNFQLEYDPAVFEPAGVAAGATALAGRKQVEGNASAPGRFSVLMSGLNQETVSDGAVAYVTMRVVGEPSEGSTRLRVANPTLATYDGVELASRGSGRMVRFGESRDEEPSEEEPPPEEPGSEPEPEPDAPEEPGGRPFLVLPGEGLLMEPEPGTRAEETAPSETVAPETDTPGSENAPEQGRPARAGQRIPGADGGAAERGEHGQGRSLERVRTAQRNGEAGSVAANAAADAQPGREDVIALFEETVSRRHLLVLGFALIIAAIAIASLLVVRGRKT
jgi:hypothetical protein